jgi:hypothetical protein
MTTTEKKRFEHPALEKIEAERRALRKVLQAVAGLDEATALRVLERAREAAKGPLSE